MTAPAVPKVHTYEPVGSAVALWRSRAPEVLLSGPAGTGKSRACLEKLHAMCMANPGMRALICRKTASSLTSTALDTYRKAVALEAMASGEVQWYSGSGQEPASYRYGNGSVIVVGGMDKASRIMSSEYDVIYVQEAIELDEDDWESLTTRLRNGVVSFQQLMADTNPGPPHHWLNQRCQQKRCEMVYCRHEDNPRLYRDGKWTPEGRVYIDRLNALTGVRKLRLLGGKWAAAEGLVYDTFNPAVHIHKPIGLPPAEWTRYWTVDFGYTNPFVCQWWALDPDGRMYLYREIYFTQRLVEDHAEILLKMVKRGDGHRADVMPRQIICDHDAEGRATLERKLNYPTQAAQKDVLSGIELVQSRLKPDVAGFPRLYLCRDAVTERDPELEESKKPCSTLEEITEYIWAEPSGAQQRESPVKRNDHGMDAMRYMAAHLDNSPSPRIRFASWGTRR